MTTKSEAKHRGTLVCVVLKAKNLPNKRSIGKQDPYCVLQMGSEQQKTKPDKRGGQHPQWDEQLHFEIYDDMEDQLRKVESGTDTVRPTTLSQATKRKDKAGKSLTVSCYADDNKEPEFIGEGIVDLTDTLRTGEFDEWVTIKAKDRYAGEVYLELTFYSSAAPPKPSKVLKPSVPANTTYGGAGTFSEDFDETEFAPRPPTKAPAHAPIPSSFVRGGNGSVTGGIGPQSSLRTQSGSSMSTSQSMAQMGNATASRLSGIEGVPSALRPSSSMAHIDSYTPPYAPPHIQRERSPAPGPSPSPLQHNHTAASRRDSFPPLKSSASAILYGHRLPDAAPSTIVAQRIEEENGLAQRHSQQFSTSSTFHNLPQASSISSVSTVRGPGQREDSIDDLVRPLSSLSMQHLPAGTDASYARYPHHQSSVGSVSGLEAARHPSPAPGGQYPPYPSNAPQQQQQPYPPQQYQYATIQSPYGDQAGRPVANQTFPPTAPAPAGYPNSNPPPQFAHPHEVSQQAWSQGSAVQQQQPPNAAPSLHPSASLHSYVSSQDLSGQASLGAQGRPVSPGVSESATGYAAPLPPPRNKTPAAYYGVPPPQAGRSASPLPGRAVSPSPHSAVLDHNGQPMSQPPNGYPYPTTGSPTKPAASRPLPPIGGQPPPPEQRPISAPQAPQYASHAVTSPVGYGPPPPAAVGAYAGQPAHGQPYAPQPPPPQSTTPVSWSSQPYPSSHSPTQPPQQFTQYVHAGYPPPLPSSADVASYNAHPSAAANGALPASASVPAHLTTHYPPPPPGPSTVDYNQYAYAQHGQYQQPPPPPQPATPLPPSQSYYYQQPASQFDAPQRPGSAQPPPVHPHPPVSYYQQH